MGGEYGKSAAR